ncbi:DUF397 domain-containing protein [Actinomadura sp. LD22]|uniref:DUF397 domain-containing protein n=1 Tax=Actinomadura physcomitrii TaxID=2650748 RepID=A0A6I4M514_9ACTN|nr:DUF397 domain-containing protein [Actinomadura physcomitrii]MWA00160.1 DUF397 domain-containing protein [Actinomadura physcomitrii]
MKAREDLFVWHKSSYSAQGADCVEVAGSASACAVRDSKDPNGPVLALTPHAWSTLVHAIKTGAHDLP